MKWRPRQHLPSPSSAEIQGASSGDTGPLPRRTVWGMIVLALVRHTFVVLYSQQATMRLCAAGLFRLYFAANSTIKANDPNWKPNRITLAGSVTGISNSVWVG